jgi:hypothetical protein
MAARADDLLMYCESSPSCANISFVTNFGNSATSGCKAWLPPNGSPPAMNNRALLGAPRAFRSLQLSNYDLKNLDQG